MRSELRALLLHSRPLNQVLPASTLLWGAAASGSPWDANLVAAVFAWSLCGSSATVLLNTYFDHDADRGPLNFVPERRPPVPYRWLPAAAAILYLVGALLLALFVPAVLLLYVAMVLLSLLYSVPPFRLKAHAGLDLLVNAVGYGGATFLAGWLTLTPLTVRAGILALLPALLIAAGHPLTTLFQVEHDARRGWRTLPVVLGHRNSVLLAAFLYAAHLALLILLVALGIVPLATAVLVFTLPTALLFFGFWALNPQLRSKDVARLGWLGANVITVFYLLVALKPL